MKYFQLYCLDDKSMHLSENFHDTPLGLMQIIFSRAHVQVKSVLLSLISDHHL